VIRFSGPSQFTDHVTMISSWTEFARFAAMIELLEIRVCGELSPQVEAWMKQFGGPIKKLDRFVGGFLRSA
jgi:hypothetical protein